MIEKESTCTGFPSHKPTLLPLGIDHFTVLGNITKPLYESEVRGDPEMIETRN